MAPLAEFIYYELGRNLAAREDWNQMTRLQLEHELRLRGLLVINDELTEWQLRLRLASAVFREKQKTEQKPKEFGVGECQDKDVSEDEDDGMRRESESCGDRDRKVIFTKNLGKTMVY
ncbi:Nn.00g089590.m01.CDS01 [Neocucurbitaria sp. VM-36]